MNKPIDNWDFWGVVLLFLAPTLCLVIWLVIISEVRKLDRRWQQHHRHENRIGGKGE